MKSSPELQERSTLAGLLRHFALALVLNQFDGGSQGLYSIPGWKGFSAPPLKASTPAGLQQTLLEKGAFLRLSTKLWLAYRNQWNSTLEAYRLIVYEDGSYEIRDRNQELSKITRKTLQDSVILLNTESDKPIPALL